MNSRISESESDALPLGYTPKQNYNTIKNFFCQVKNMYNKFAKIIKKVYNSNMGLDVLKIIKLNSVLGNLLEGFDDFLYTKEINLTNKDKILILLTQKPLSPFNLIKSLSIAKSNLALCAEKLIKENYIIKEKDAVDKRNIVYKLTKTGEEKASEILNKLNKALVRKLEHKNNFDEINKTIEKLLNLLK